MHENFGVFRREEQMLQQGEIVGRAARALRARLVDDKGEVFNNDVTQTLELGFLLDLAACMIVAGLARKESRGAHARPVRLPGPRRRELHAHTMVTWEDDEPKLDWAPVRVTKWPPRRAGPTR